MNKRFWAIIKKEFIHIIRDPRTLLITLAMPLLMIIIYGNAIKLDIKNIPIGIIDYDNSIHSRNVIEKFTQSGYFEVAAPIENRRDIQKLFKQRTIKAAIIIPVDFSKSIHINPATKIQIIIDGSNSNTATIISNYCKMILVTYTNELNMQILKPPVSTEPRVWYNPDLESANFIIPGLVAIILMMICALLTSITIAREKETGTMEQILVSPIRPLEIIFGKVLPYVIIAFIDGVLVILAAKYGFDISISGSILLLGLLSFVYLYAALSIGVLISVNAKTQQVALMLALLITILPAVLLSGFIFPIRSMPLVLRFVSYLIPAKYYLIIIRGIILKGVGISYLWGQILFLFVMGTLLLLISTSKFKSKLD